ncbi:hypothetical protein AAIH46_13315 [Rhizobium sp. 0TCS1.26]|uniref:hypothetical protein n=1 Tax=Rhizobium sp. 0TCS1.26 TaxID=3142623 RepID=UPI003D268CA1
MRGRYGRERSSFRTGGATHVPAIDNWLNRNIISVLNRSALVKLVGLAIASYSLHSLYITNEALRDELNDRIEEREMRADEKLLRAEERIERAWNSLLLRSGGNTGKGEHISFLIKSGRGLEGVDLSCEAIGQYNSENRACIKEPIFSNVDIARPDSMTRVMMESMYTMVKRVGAIPEISQPPSPVQAEIGKSTFIELKALSAIWNLDRLKSTTFLGSSLDENFFYNKPVDLNIGYSDLSFSYMTTDIINPNVFKTNVSGVVYEIDISDAPRRFARLVKWNAAGNWAWADVPPLQFSENGLTASPAGLLRGIVLCDPAFRENKSAVEINSVGTGYMERQDVKGHLRHMGDPVCEHQLSFADAAKQFPNVYPVDELAGE